MCYLISRPLTLLACETMKTMIRTGILLLLFSAGQASLGQTAAPVEIDLDHAAFAYDDAESMLEVYLAFGAASLTYEAGDEGYRAELPLNIAVMRSTDATLTGTPSDPIWQDGLTLAFAIADTVGLEQGQYFIRQARLTIAPGEYELRVTVPADAAHGRQTLELRRDVLVPDFGDSDLGFSDVTLASVIAPSQDRGDLFYKNGLVIRPNANQLYGQGLNKLYYYAEAYNVGDIASDDGKYTLLAYLAEANRPQPLPGLQKRSQRDARTPDVLVGTFTLDELPSGSYFLRLVLLNEHNESMAEQSRKFFVFNPGIAQEPVVALESSFETSPYASMAEEEVERGFEHIKIIATEQEQRRARGLQDLDEKRRFLMEFWLKRDPEPNTPINEFREEFYGRLQYANQRYTVSNLEGWKTDRGRVLIRYGSPSTIEPHLYDRGFKPYELWQYNNIPGEGQALFVFADLTAFGEFELIHSTVAGERKMVNWLNELSEANF